MLQENLFYPLFHCSALSLDPDRQYPIHIFLCRVSTPFLFLILETSLLSF